MLFLNIFAHCTKEGTHGAIYSIFMYEKQAAYILILMMYRCLCFLQSFDLVYVLVFASLSSPLSADEVGAVPLQGGRGHVSAA